MGRARHRGAAGRACPCTVGSARTPDQTQRPSVTNRKPSCRIVARGCKIRALAPGPCGFVASASNMLHERRPCARRAALARSWSAPIHSRPRRRVCPARITGRGTRYAFEDVSAVV
ncbi:hypothetical protein Cus16_1130 [Curtobacterium sp. ER1/6]|nr:hypothetical protein Cus16_1130 [Curtobacterium sp. ER1/6]